MPRPSRARAVATAAGAIRHDDQTVTSIRYRSYDRERRLSAPVLLADVGGTNVRFALADPLAPMPLLPDSIHRYAVADFPSLADAARHYVDATGTRVAQGIFAIAGRVDRDEGRLTNHPWSVSGAHIRARLPLERLQLVNDFVAQAMAVCLLRDDDLFAIGPARPSPANAQARTCAVLGPGTGLGVGALVVRDGNAIALATEGGHVSFAPATEEEIAILRHLSGRFGHVSNERLVSGSGLVNLHAALQAIAGAGTGDFDRDPAEITAGADAGDPRCLHAVALFCAIFGSVAGDIALALGAWDGVYLSGGLVPRLLPELQQSGFRGRFEAKGRYAAALAQVPTLAVLHPQPGLLGAAAIACDPSRKGAPR
jgi:glucokinase